MSKLQAVSHKKRHLSVCTFQKYIYYFGLLFFPYFCKGPSINDVMALGGKRYQGFYDNGTKALALKSVTKRGRGCQKLLDVIYGRLLKCVSSLRRVMSLGYLWVKTDDWLISLDVIYLEVI